MLVATGAINTIGHFSHEHHPLLAAFWRGDLPECLGVIGFPTCTPEGILVHHTATGPQAASDDFARIDGFHRSRGFCTFWRLRTYHIGYHYLVRSDGEVEAGRPERCQGAHAGSLADNRRLLGVAVAGDFTTSNHPPDVQLGSLRALIRLLCGRYDIRKERVLPHRTVVPTTECPGRSFPWADFLASL